ncbi:MAG: hypothetical protein HYS18_16455 [Burkholderiales bacterium]|nr:hypothetical protein [Burkholderiales bacterium]
MFRFANPSSQRLIAIALALALLCAQWTGLSHRIAHADGKTTWSSMNIATDSDTSKDLSHSCSLLDAATLGNGIHTAPFTLALPINVRVLALWTAFASWSAPFTCHFSSRAPPRI